METLYANTVVSHTCYRQWVVRPVTLVVTPTTTSPSLVFIPFSGEPLVYTSYPQGGRVRGRLSILTHFSRSFHRSVGYSWIGSPFVGKGSRSLSVSTVHSCGPQDGRYHDYPHTEPTTFYSAHLHMEGVGQDGWDGVYPTTSYVTKVEN